MQPYSIDRILGNLEVGDGAKSRGGSDILSVETIERFKKEIDVPKRAMDFNYQYVVGDETLPIVHHLKNTEPQTSANYGFMFLTDRPYLVYSITEVHGTAATSAGVVTVSIERLQGTEAFGSGDNLLSTAFDLKTSEDVVQYGAMVTTDKRVLGKGDRLALVATGAPASIKDLTITVMLKQIYPKVTAYYL